MTLSIFHAAADAPGRTALVSDERTLSYSDLASEVRAAVAWLRSRGVGRESSPRPVAAVANRDLHTVAMLHALFALGVPVLPLSPKLTPSEQSRVVDTAGAYRLDHEFGLAPAPATKPGARLVPVPDDVSGRPPPVQPAHEPDPVPVPDDARPLAIVFTSGSAGSARGVVLSRRAFAASARGSAENLGWREDDRWLLALPLAHVGGLSVLTRCLLARRAVVLPRSTDARTLLSAMEAHRVTLVSLVPTQLRRLLEHAPDSRPPASLRAVLIGGAAAPRPLLLRAADRGWPVLATYGLTEACSQVTAQPLRRAGRVDPGVGAPLAGIEIRIVRDRIQVRGPTLLSATLPPTPGLLDAEGWYETQDLGRIDHAGNLHVIGRADNVIVTGGENVSPTEVEEALLGCADVADACVFGVADETWGQAVAAAIVLREGVGCSTDSITRQLRDRLAPYKLPRRFAFVSRLAETASGKHDRAQVAREATPLLEPKG